MVLPGEAGVIGGNVAVFTKDPTWQYEVLTVRTVTQSASCKMGTGSLSPR
jgi:hypothetical protein